MDPWQTVEDLSPGNAQLRHQISLRYGSVGMDVPASELVITSGAMEALNLALESVTQPGDVVAIETPTFYGALQALERRGLRAVEVETHPRTGVDLSSLARVIDQHPVKACWFMPTFQNPMGCTMSDAAKEQLVSMLTTRAIPLIEDDVYGELAHGARRPPPAKAWDRAGWVLHCSSFSKSLAPGYRIGWVAGGRFAATLGRNKLMSSLATALPSQLALQEYLQHRSFDRHLRALRHSLSRQQAACLRLIERYFPTGTRVTRRGWLFPVARAARRRRLARTAPGRSSARHRRSAGPFVFSRPPIHPAPAHQLRASRRPALGRGYKKSWRTRRRAA